LIPESFEVKEATVGKGKKLTQEIVTTSYAFVSEKLRQIPAAQVQFKRAAACKFSIL
jgi:hypothetical protein